MKIITCTTGALAENCYIIYDSKVAAVIDPGDDADVILDIIDKNGLEVKYILLTHGHFDHIGAVKEIKDKTGALVCIHKEDAFMLVDSAKNLSSFMGELFKTDEADILLRDGSVIDLDGIEIKVLHTPGHTPGGVCYLAGDVMFSGDTLFFMSIGRSDFPYSDPGALDHSLNCVIKSLEKDYKVYPGHGDPTTLSFEKCNNPYLR